MNLENAWEQTLDGRGSTSGEMRANRAARETFSTTVLTLDSQLGVVIRETARTQGERQHRRGERQ